MGLPPQEVEPIHKSVHELGYDVGSTYLPAIKLGSCTPHETGVRFNECAMLNPTLVAMSRGQVNFAKVEEVIKTHFDITAVTDDSPFFFKAERGLPRAISLVLWSSTVMLLLAILVPRLYLGRKLKGKLGPGHYRRSSKNLPSFIVFFAALGVGFMLVEISIIQRFTLFLGQPVLSLAFLLFSLLLGAGMGSMYSSRFSADKMARVIALASAIAVAVLLVYAFYLPLILKQLLGLSLATRILATVALTTPLGFALGFPFPLGLRLLKEAEMGHYIPWMWGINGIGSVVGSAMTMAIATSFGFTAALLLGAVSYFIVFLCIRLRSRVPDSGVSRIHNTLKTGGY